MLIWHYLTKGESGLIGERHKTIILLRLSTIAQLCPEGGAERSAQGFAVELPQRFIARQRTQQNDRGFVAFAGVTGGMPPGKFSIKARLTFWGKSTG